MLRTYSTRERRIYLMTHFDHPRELTDVAVRAIDLVQQAGVVTANQSPLIRGVNSDPPVLANLFNRLSYIGVAPYYLFQCRPTAGNFAYAIPIEEGFQIFEQGRMNCSGLAKRARYVMSHSTGKVEVVGLTDQHVFMRYHRSADPENKARFLVLLRNPEAYWWDDYQEVQSEYSIENPFRCYGPE